MWYSRYIGAALALFLGLLFAGGLQMATGQGLELDEAVYAEIPLAPVLMRSANNMTKRASLKAYAPYPGNQGNTNTCVGWATAYAARSILEAQRIERTDREQITRHAFSPAYVYNQIREGADTSCQSGTLIGPALELLKNEGTLLHQVFPIECERSVLEADRALAEQYRIKEYHRLFQSDESDKISPIKRSLAAGRPVVAGLMVPDSFTKLHGAKLWIPGPNDAGVWGHAVAIVGYDDEKYGGAFEVMNSWGIDWGDRGFIWMRYRDVDRFVREAYELIGSDPLSNDTSQFSGRVHFHMIAGTSVEATYEDGFYSMNTPLVQGALFQLHATSDQPAYLYAFATDSAGEVFNVYPFLEHTSPYLPDDSSTVVMPHKDLYLEYEYSNVEGEIYVLFSQEPIDVPALLEQVRKTEGQLAETIAEFLGPRWTDHNKIMYFKHESSFVMQAEKDSIVPLRIKLTPE